MLWAEVRFTQPDLSDDDLLLFNIRSEIPRRGPYDTLFMTDLGTRSLTQLTHFPERLFYLASQKVLHLQNRFGVFHSDEKLEDFQLSALFPSFVEDNSMLRGSLNALNISPNGRYVLYVEGTSPAFGDLYFVDMEEGQRLQVTKGVEIELTSSPAVWSPDSSFFVYSKNGYIYYMSIRQLAEQRPVEEAYRQIGEGQIGSISPGGAASVYYLSESLVYELDGAELFTRALYRGYLDIGRLVGKIPFSFDPNFDSFRISPSGTHILLNKGGRNLFLYLLSTEDFSSAGGVQSLPYLYLPRNSRIRRVLWDETGLLTILAGGSENGRSTSQIFRIEVARMTSDSGFRKIDMESAEDILLSPDKSRAAVIVGDRVVVYDYRSWDEITEYDHTGVVQVAWISAEQLVIAGAHTIELYSLDGGSRRLLGVSQPKGYSFSADGEAVIATAGGKTFGWTLEPESASAAGWHESEAGLRSRLSASGAYRVYLEDTPDRLFHNMLMIRDRQRLITTPLLQQRSEELEPFPKQEDPLDFVTFDHGSRIRRREISLVFNVIDSVEGLPTILSTLKDFGERCTFFVNGEAIRNYPDAVREISRSGHEVGSLFSMYFDMTDARFRLDTEFIKKGLAQNEDEYFAATGKELSLLWHAPYYFVNSDIIRASREMNYVYVGRDVDPLDWVTREMGVKVRDIYFPASKLVERVIAEKKPGSIIPILVGRPEGERDDYLFHKLDLLIDALLKRGYDIVPVSVLIEHAE
jgi:peptidoglycan/xylan/chitin deacetylase (PgdA/CDA1 family)